MPNTKLLAKTRKGARNIASVDPAILIALENGTIETANLTEGLAIDMRLLLAAVAPQLPADLDFADKGVVQRMAYVGAVLRNYGLAQLLAGHTSDTVRGWAAFAIGQDEETPPMARLDAIMPFAADPHFGVREWAWMAVRAIIVADPLASIAHMKSWTAHNDPNIRRFTSEATRPRGVWAASIPILRKQPEHGLLILSPLRRDTHRYVQDSVANWLNDAAKDRPDWVKILLTEWAQEGVESRLITRAGRSL
jgi:3-methyladenine DNA glycosylase AlkC